MANSIICRPPSCNSAYIVPCSKVEACINKNLHEIIDGEDSGIPDFCAATSVCTNALLRALPGYSSSSFVYLTFINGVLGWESSTSAYTNEMAQNAVGSILSPEFIFDSSIPAILINNVDWAKIINVPVTTVVSQNVQSGDGLTLSFSIAHGFASTPKVVLTAGSQDTSGVSYITIDSTNIVIYYNVAPPTGTNNLIFNYTANL